VLCTTRQRADCGLKRVDGREEEVWVRGINEWLTVEDESTAAVIGEGTRGGGNEGMEGNLGARVWGRDW